MRTIKYRAKVKYNGTHYFSGDWVYGYIVDTGTDMFIVDTSEDDYGNVRYSQVSIIPETVGQYTGLKDKKGTEIYHKDKIKSQNNILYTVEWAEEEACFYARAGNIEYKPKFWFESEVIGNIHEECEK